MTETIHRRVISINLLPNQNSTTDIYRKVCISAWFTNLSIFQLEYWPGKNSANTTHLNFYTLISLPFHFQHGTTLQSIMYAKHQNRFWLCHELPPQSSLMLILLITYPHCQILEVRSPLIYRILELHHRLLGGLVCFDT